jgi:hypothetical protein
MRRNLTDTVRELPHVLAQLFDPYRPELHYMRGPGPKWHERRAATAPKTSPALRDTAPARSPITEPEGKPVSAGSVIRDRHPRTLSFTPTAP